LIMKTITGSFRFVSGAQSAHNYQVQFPQGYLTVRGTTVDLLAGPARSLVVFVEGSITVVANATGNSRDLSAPGTSLIVYNDGHMDGPLSRAAAINRLRLPSNQFASTMWAALEANTGTPVPACDSKPPFLPWGGTGSATITVSGGKASGVGWHDTPGGPGGVTVLDSMSVSSPPSHGTLKPQDQHVIVFTPAPGYKGQDSFTLSMQEHNGGRSRDNSVGATAPLNGLPSDLCCIAGHTLIRPQSTCGPRCVRAVARFHGRRSSVSNNL
jgi:hypothetical protein